MQSLADVPLGAFLSGGVDSSAIVALMQNDNPTPIKTFTIGFEESQFDESKYAKLKGLVINGEYDKTIDPVNSKHIANTFLKLGADIQMTELKMVVIHR